MEATIQKINDSILSIIISLIITLFIIFAIYNISNGVPTEYPVTNTATMQWSTDTSGWVTGWYITSN